MSCIYVFVFIMYFIDVLVCMYLRVWVCIVFLLYTPSYDGSGRNQW